MACFFVCGANNTKPIQINEPPTGVVNQPIPQNITSHIQHCPHCHKKYNPTMNNITTFQHIENALYITTHFPSPRNNPKHHNNLQLVQSICPLTPRTPKTPTIDPDSAIRVKEVIQYTPSRSGTHSNSPNTSVLVDMYTHHTASSDQPKTIASLNQSTSSTVHDLYVPRPLHDIDGDRINFALSPILNDIPSSNKDISSKYLPPPMHKFNQLSVTDTPKTKTKKRTTKTIRTPSNSPKDLRQQLWQVEGLSPKQKKKMDRIVRKVQKLKDAKTKKESRKQMMKKRKDVLTHIHHHHEHFHHHHYHHPNEVSRRKRNKEMLHRKHRKHGNTNGFFTEKYKHKYMDYFDKTPELPSKYKKKQNSKTKKQTNVSRHYPAAYDEGFEGCVHAQAPYIIGNSLSIVTDEYDGKEATIPTQSQSSFSYEYHSD
eukprot:369600_1